MEEPPDPEPDPEELVLLPGPGPGPPPPGPTLPVLPGPVVAPDGIPCPAPPAPPDCEPPPGVDEHAARSAIAVASSPRGERCFISCSLGDGRTVARSDAKGTVLLVNNPNECKRL